MIKPRYLILLIFLITSCNEGLQPPPPVEKSYITGLITYVNGKDNWPPPDSVIDIRVAAFKNYPPMDIITEITNGNAFFTETLPQFVDTSSYFLEIPEPPVTIEYLVVAQQYGTLFEWLSIGVWTLSGDNTKPSSITIEPGKIYTGLNIIVDFNHLPPQPFEK